MIRIKSLHCTKLSCFKEFKGLTEKGNNIVIYYRSLSDLLRILIDDMEVVREFFPSPKNGMEDATLEEIQERVIFHGISFPQNCTLSGLKDELMNNEDWTNIFQ